MSKRKKLGRRNNPGFIALSTIFMSFVLLPPSCLAQTTPTTGEARTSGRCSPAVTGDNNQVTINCQGVTKQQEDEFIKILNTVLVKKLDTTVVLSKLDEIQSGVSDIKGELEKKNQREEEAERIRRTAPEIDAFLKPMEKGKVYLMIKSNNLIPFQFRYFIVKSDNTIVGGFPINDATFYPRQGNDLFHVEKDIDLDQIADHYIELRFSFKSLSDDELHLPGHEGEIIRKYRIETGGTLSLIQ